MTTQFVEHNGKKYPVTEPTIKVWGELMNKRELYESHEFYMRIIEMSTGIPYAELEQAPADEVLTTGDLVFRFINQEQKKIFPKIEHKGKTYTFIDVQDMSFGQFIDIDSFLTKDETYRVQNLNELAAYFYVEEGTKYGETPIKKRIEDFKELPVKVVEGAIFFLLSSARASEEITKIYSHSKFLYLMMNLKIVFHLIGVGIQQSAHYVRNKYGVLVMLLAYPFISASTICLTLWTYIKNVKNNLKKK
jgi:hypothetical protein